MLYPLVWYRSKWGMVVSLVAIGLLEGGPWPVGVVMAFLKKKTKVETPLPIIPVNPHIFSVYLEYTEKSIHHFFPNV